MRTLTVVTAAIVAVVFAHAASAATLTVSLVNAVNGNAVSAAHVEASVLGKVLASGSTSSAGSVSLSYTTDSQIKVITVSVIAANYYSLTTTTPTTSTSLRLEVSPRLSNSADEMRIVLSWGNTIRDLDSHLVGPKCTVYYGRKQCSASGVTQGFNSDLDIDDTTYQGPETMTIRNPSSGVFSYFVHIYTTGKCWNQEVAKVRFFGSKKGGALLELESPSANVDKCTGVVDSSSTCNRYWHVLDYDVASKKLITVNKLVGSKTLPTDLADTATLGAESGTSACAACPSASTNGGTDGALTTIAQKAATNLAPGLISFIDTYSCPDDADTTFSKPTHGAFQSELSSTSLLSSLQSQMTTAIERRVWAIDAMARKWAASATTTPPARPSLGLCCDTCSACAVDRLFSTTPIDRLNGCLRRPQLYGNPGSSLETFKTAIPAAEMQRLADVASSATTSQLEDKGLRWAYIGTKSGANMIAPRLPTTPLNCFAYDPRVRPWWAEAVTGRKHVSVMLDLGGSSTQNSVARAAATAVIDTLSAGDSAAVFALGRVTTSSSGPTYRTMGSVGVPPFTACMTDALLRMTEQNKQIAKQFIREADATSAGTTATGSVAAMTKHWELMVAKKADGASVQGLVFYVSGRDDASLSSSALASTNPGTALPFNVSMFAYAPAGSASLTTWGQVSPRTTTGVITASTAPVVPALYHFESRVQRAASSKPVVTSLYEDSSGLGLVVTVVKVLWSGGEVDAAIGLDIPIDDLVAPLQALDLDFSYAFLSTPDHVTVYHPRGSAVPVAAVETDPEFASKVLPRLSASTPTSASSASPSTGSDSDSETDETGPVSITRPATVATNGDIRVGGFQSLPQTRAYAWASVAPSIVESSFVIVAAASSIEKQRFTYDATNVAAPTCADAQISKCDGYHSSGNGGCDIGVYFAPKAFKDPYAWASRAESWDNVTSLMVAARSGVASAASGLTAEAAVQAKMTSTFNACFRRHSASTVVRRYVGTSAGVWRSYPRSPQSRNYDPTRRPWYEAAVAARNPLDQAPLWVATAPYLDSTTNTPVATVALAVPAPRTSATSPSAIAAVLGVDVETTVYTEMMKTAAPECSTSTTGARCMLVDANGFVAWTSFKAVSGATFLSEYHTELAKKLAEQKVLMRQRCVSMPRGDQRYSFVFNASLLPAAVPLTCGRARVEPVAKTNLFVVVLGDTCDRAYAQCTACSVDSCARLQRGEVMRICQPCACVATDAVVQEQQCGLFNSSTVSGGDSSEEVPACPTPPPDLSCSPTAPVGGSQVVAPGCENVETPAPTPRPTLPDGQTYAPTPAPTIIPAPPFSSAAPIARIVAVLASVLLLLC